MVWQVVVLVVTLVWGVQGQHYNDAPNQWTRANYPDPQTDPVRCGRLDNKPSYICDPNMLITYEEANQLDQELNKLVNKTKCPCSSIACMTKPLGHRVGIALMREMAPESGQEYKKDGDKPSVERNLAHARLFAYTLVNRWNWGQCNETVVILYSLVDNVLYTMTDDTAHLTLEPHLVGEISMRARHYFGSGNNANIFEGLRKIIMHYKAVFDGQYESNVEDFEPQVGASRSSAPGTVSICLATSIMSLIAAVMAPGWR